MYLQRTSKLIEFSESELTFPVSLERSSSRAPIPLRIETCAYLVRVLVFSCCGPCSVGFPHQAVGDLRRKKMSTYVPPP